jgi:hypothetical protein
MLGRNMMPWMVMEIETMVKEDSVVAMVMDEVEVPMVEVMVIKGEVTMVGMSML